MKDHPTLVDILKEMQDTRDHCKDAAAHMRLGRWINMLTPIVVLAAVEKASPCLLDELLKVIADHANDGSE